MVGAFFMPEEICFLCPFLRKEVSAVANRIMGITVEIGRDTTKLQTALKSVRSLIRRILLQPNRWQILSWIIYRDS